MLKTVPGFNEAIGSVWSISVRHMKVLPTRFSQHGGINSGLVVGVGNLNSLFSFPEEH